VTGTNGRQFFGLISLAKTYKSLSATCCLVFPCSETQNTMEAGVSPPAGPVKGTFSPCALDVRDAADARALLPRRQAPHHSQRPETSSKFKQLTRTRPGLQAVGTCDSSGRRSRRDRRARLVIHHTDMLTLARDALLQRRIRLRVRPRLRPP
jgi:hypothetical protein